jgi:nucleoside-diphosphate-sugar epimerase
VKVAVFGATGVVGLSAVRHFAGMDDTEVLAVSRRPRPAKGATPVSLDLTDRAVCAQTLGSSLFAGTTHVVFAALQEAVDLASGWRDPELMRLNLAMFDHALGPLSRSPAGTLRHVSLLQGAKAYGFHLGRTPLPAKESQTRDRHDNFYFLQEDSLRARAAEAGWAWTILRPQVVFGGSIGSPMNLVPALGVYAALERQAGRPLSWPGGPPSVQEAVDADLLARVLGWAARSPHAAGQTFNVTNGDVYCWHDVWPTVAARFGMHVGPPAPARLAAVMPTRSSEWETLVDRYRLAAPRDMAAFVGGSWSYADILFDPDGRRALPVLLSTVKLRQAGFNECMDTELMLGAWIARFQEQRLLPGA